MYPHEAVMKMQAEEGCDEGGITKEAEEGNASNSGLHVGAIALAIVKPKLKLAADGHGVE